MTKALIEELRELSDRVFHGDTKPGDFRIIDRAADALAAVPDAATEGRMSLAELEDIAETHAFCADRLSIETERADRVAREVCDRGCSYTGGPDEECSAHGRTPRELWEFIAQDVVGRDAATERAEKAEAERDAALAAVGRCRGVLANDELVWSDGSYTNDLVVEVKDVLAALDGAPEPEDVWEYGSGPEDALDQSGLHTSRTAAERGVAEWNGFTQRSERVGGRPLERLVLVRRRKAGPWEPVEGESK